jgi:hypothetical protein
MASGILPAVKKLKQWLCSTSYCIDDSYRTRLAYEAIDCINKIMQALRLVSKSGSSLCENGLNVFIDPPGKSKSKRQNLSECARAYELVCFDEIWAEKFGAQMIESKSIHMACGFTAQGSCDILGMWQSEKEDENFWLGVLWNLKEKGICRIDAILESGQEGLTEAVYAVLPETEIRCLMSPHNPRVLSM